MDFGDILEQWEKRTDVKRGKADKDPCEPRRKTLLKQPEADPCGPRRGKLLKQPEAEHPLTIWLEHNEVYDKDAACEAAEREYQTLYERADAVIDLHGLTQYESWSALEDFFEDARRQGVKKIIIIHGKGNHSPGEAVLTQLAKRFIKTCPFAGKSGHEQPEYGGSGATWVLLKPPSP
ncbi:MAG: Smr/MutS family protein, partial [Spirochaetaceae bacterium]|nr:Smr/MutS family protein [Spirochaetaceae bacterium]